MDLSIIPECYVDTCLLETIVPPQGKGYNHQKGCGTVALKMINNFSDQFAVGIIDKDKNQIDYLNEFNELINTGSLILYKHKTRPHYIIQIYPAIERFILLSASSVGIELSNYNLPDDFNQLKMESKTKTSKTDRRFIRLFKDLQREGAPDIIKLAKWITYLRGVNYNVDVGELKNL